jgi:uncharacterized protein (TIGR02246 family)
MNAKLISFSSTFKLASVVTMGIVIIAVSIISTGIFNMAVAQTAEDSAAVLAQVEKYQNIWDTHGAAALAVFFTEDAEFVMGNQTLIRGRNGIQNWWQMYFNRQEVERKLTIDINSLRIIAPDVALLNIRTTTGGKDNQGKNLQARKARGTWVMLKQNGNWFITTMLGMPTEEDKIIRNIDKPEIEIEGTFEPVGPPLKTPIRNEIGEGCIVEIKQPYNITGTLNGKLEIDFRILVYGPCGEPPGTYNEEWIAFGSFTGTIDGTLKTGKFTYTANVKVGGDVEGKIIFGQGLEGELLVKGNFKDGKLSYYGELNK